VPARFHYAPECRLRNRAAFTFRATLRGKGFTLSGEVIKRGVKFD
jgi:hypothetical protein